MKFSTELFPIFEIISYIGNLEISYLGNSTARIYLIGKYYHLGEFYWLFILTPLCSDRNAGLTSGLTVEHADSYN